jgi:hypothetical protein
MTHYTKRKAAHDAALADWFFKGFASDVHDAIPHIGGSLREAWLVGAYFMRAELPRPASVTARGKTIIVDGNQYRNEPSWVGTKTVLIAPANSRA